MAVVEESAGGSAAGIPRERESRKDYGRTRITFGRNGIVVRLTESNRV
jgi:hypothetical protein